MKTAADVSQLITDLKNKGTVLSEVAWKAALACVGWAYVFGARGEYCDPSNRRSRAREDYPTIKSACKNFNGSDLRPSGCVGCKWFLGTAESDETKHEGRTRFFDCRGFTYWILKQVYGFELQGGGATAQWGNASNWSSKGEIATMPKDTLVCLFVKKGNTMEHTGFGLNNETVECSSGVQHFTTRNKKWTHWAVPKCVDAAPSPTPSPAPGTFIVTGKNVALRTAPSTSGTILMRVATNSVVEKAESTDEWELVSYKGKTGYMMKQFLKG